MIKNVKSYIMKKKGVDKHMKFRNDNGITLAVLILTVLILIIISSVVVNVSYNLINEAKFQNVKTDLLLIQSKCKIKSEQKAIGEIKEEDLYGNKQTDGTYKRLVFVITR